jgi:predicted alpha/beta hydrolase family esterase
VQKPVLFIHGAGDGAYEEDELLATSLRDALGPGYAVRYPRMPTEDSATYEDWIAPIEAELARLDQPVILVGHSVGGSVLLKYLSETRVAPPPAGLFVIATPFWGADEFWRWDEARLPSDAAARLAYLPRLILYHSRDDVVVPFDHMALYTGLLPDATSREVDGRGHQFGNDLVEVAQDIMSASRAL